MLKAVPARVISRSVYVERRAERKSPRPQRKAESGGKNLKSENAEIGGKAEENEKNTEKLSC